MQTGVPLNIVLHENQKVIHASKARYKTIKAGKRFGKTKWALFEIVQKAGMKPNGLFWYTAPTYKQAKGIAWQELKWIIPKGFVKRWLEVDLTVEFVNGARLELKGEDNQDSLRGTQMDGIARDEVAMNQDGEYCWNAILRGQLKPQTGFAYHISSPNKTGRNWYTNFCEEAKRRQVAGDPEWAYWHFTIYDNPTYPAEEREKLKEGMPEYIWNLEYMALESDFAGQKYSEFNTEKNVGTYDGDRVFPVYRGIDWGLEHPTVCLWAKVDMENKLVWIYDEYVKSGFTIRENVEVVKEKTGPVPVEWSVIDPSANRRDPITKRALIDEFARWGLTCIPGDRRDRGTDIVKMFLKRGYVKIHPKCKTLIYELRNLQWGDKEGDDATDTLRYLLTRIHDTIHGMNILTEDIPVWRPNPSNPREMNINDTSIFPERRENASSWVMDEIGD